MSQETVVRPEPIVKILMGLAVLSLITIAICQVILVLRPSQQPVLRRPILPIENRTTQQGIPPFPPGLVPAGSQAGQGLSEAGNRSGQPNLPNPNPEKPTRR